MISICFVCHGNICRSPTAAGVMTELVRAAGLEAQVTIDSAGVSAEHLGEGPDRRAVAAAARRGYDLPGQAWQFRREDFDRFDHVLAMDRDNLRRLHKLSSDPAHRGKTELLRRFDPNAGDDLDVPDPWYDGGRAFETVLDICERGCRGLLEHLRRGHGL